MPKMSEEVKARRAAQRKANEEELAALEAAWEASKPLRLLNAMARANELPDAEIRVFYRFDDVLYYSYKINPMEYPSSDSYAELSEHVMQLIEQELTDYENEMRRVHHLSKIKADLIARLTDEEKEALGL